MTDAERLMKVKALEGIAKTRRLHSSPAGHRLGSEEPQCEHA